MAKLLYTLSACMDCIAFEANGDIPEDRPNIADEIAGHLGLSPYQHLVSASGLDSNSEYYKDSNDQPIDCDHPGYECSSEYWFSWSACECCGSHLGGNRNRLAVLASYPAYAIGQRLVIREDIPAFNLGNFPKGATGTVLNVHPDCGDDDMLAVVKMDQVFPELAEWDNELHIFAEGGEVTPDYFEIVHTET